MSLVDYTIAVRRRPEWRRVRLQPGLWLAWAVMIAALLMAIAPQWFTSSNPLEGIPGAQRLARAEVVRVRPSEYVDAARGSGGTFFAVFWRHILPNSLTAVLAFATLQFGQAMLALATLSFLGYGTPPPVPEWGLLIAEGRNYLSTAWWLTTFPGLAVVAVVLAANRLSRQWSGARP